MVIGSAGASNAGIGVQVDAIERGEDRIAFKEQMNRLGIPLPKSAPAYTIEEGERIAAELGYPVVLRPAYTMGGTGGGLVYNVDELRTVMARGLAASFAGGEIVERAVEAAFEEARELRVEPERFPAELALVRRASPVWIAVGVPFIVPLTVGFFATLVLGDTLFYLLSILRGG